MSHMQIRDLMNKDVVSITSGESAALAARLLARHNLGSLPVCSESGKLEGMITDRDIVVRCVAAQQDPREKKVGDIMSRDVETISPADSACTAARRMADRQVRPLPLVEDGKLVGMLALGDLAVRHSCEMEAAEALCEISENVTSAKE